MTLLRDPVFTPSDITRIFTKAVDLEAGGDEISYTDYIANVQNQIKKILLIFLMKLITRKKFNYFFHDGLVCFSKIIKLHFRGGDPFNLFV